MIRDPYAVIKMPLLSEKSDKLKEGLNKIVLIVDRKANKVDVRHAIEQLFKVKVVDVNIINVRGKVKRLGARSGKRPDWKKAVATLAPGQKVEFIEGV
jgi:large subunit ribosomal protein L23